MNDENDRTSNFADFNTISLESGQIVLRYPALSASMSQRMMPDLGPGVRGGKNAYWCNFAKDENWQERLLDVLERLQGRVIDAKYEG